MSAVEEPYLSPYLRAARQHGSGFGSLLWASPLTQRARFEAIRRLIDPAGAILLDAGCGRGDFLEFLIEQGAAPASYVGIEGVNPLAAAARARQFPNARIIQADFVREPARLFAGADFVVFSGSLNTLGDDEFGQTLRRAYDAAGTALVFNFLCSPRLAGRDYLHWRSTQAVFGFVSGFCAEARLIDDYLEGDCTACLLKPIIAHDSEATDA
jgi:SAM-dependent methyltransferase